MSEGRWRCQLCEFPTWRRGDYASWMRHYELYHHEEARDE